MITLGPLQWLDDRQMVFGEVLPSSQALIDTIESLYSTTDWTITETPLGTVTIYNCTIH